VDGEAVLLDVETGMYYGLDGVGTRIWQLLETGASEEEISASLLEQYAADAAEVRADVAGFLADLRAKGLARATA
jgi:hypothetical protein